MNTSPNPTTDTGPIYFFRETETPFGFLSQWYTSPFAAPPPSSSRSKNPMTFLTTEQYMMYHKAIAFKDQEIAEKIIKEAKPRKQKSLGRQVKNFEAEKWDKQKTQVVEDGNYWKFMQPRIDEDLRKMLLETGDRLLVEASPFDRVWGIGYSAANAEGNKGNWGENLLGKALMRVRDRLRATEVSESVEKATDAKNKS